MCEAQLSISFENNRDTVALLVSVIVVAAAKILKTTNVVLKAFSPLIYRKLLRLYIPIYLIGLQQGHEPEAIDFVLAALHAHIGVLQWAEEKTAANGGLHMLKWN